MARCSAPPALLLLLGLTACGPGRASGGEETGDSDDETTSLADSSESESAGPESSESDSTDDPDPTDPTGFVPDTGCAGAGFYCTPGCEIFAQDCPEGEKCTAYASSGGTWDAEKCVFVMGDLEPGEPCTYDGRVEATDDCGPTSMCYDGFCRSFCPGIPEDPMCPDGFGCTASSYGDPLALCLAHCDPLAQDCAAGSCYWHNDQFLCNPTGGIAIGEPCGFVSDCGPGNACIDQLLVPGCIGASCCSPYCNLEQPDCAGLPGTECVAWFDPGEAPDGLDHVGVCVTL